MSRLIIFGRRARLVAVILLLAASGAAIASAGGTPPQTVAALQAPILSDQVQATPIEVSCTIGDAVSTTACEIDTGNEMSGIVVNQNTFTQIQGTPQGQQTLTGVTGGSVANVETATLTIGDRSATVTVYGLSNWSGPPLVGPYVLSRLYGSLTIDFQHGLVQLGGVRLLPPPVRQIAPAP
jgi:hypothetical protein